MQKSKKNHKRTLWTIICQQTGQPRRNGQVSRNIQPAKTKSRRNRYFYRPVTGSEIASIIFKKFPANKFQDRMASLGNSTKHTKKNLYRSFSNSSKRVKRKKHSWRHSMKSPSPWYQNQRHYQKRKLQANIFNEYGCKNSQQNMSKPNSTTHKKNHIP